ncbi:MAG: hypothetical protein EA406_12290 [Rhodospirillales bacterium]|nr:MAG: hypothetical protein EA406_12290 [Rhodospirillales bacterium]
MWWSSARSRSVLAAALIIALAGCGFQPMHAPLVPSSQQLAAGFAATEVGLIADREGQILRDELRYRLGIGTSTVPPRYRLNVSLSESLTDAALQRTGLATRAELLVRARYTLTEVATGEVLLQETAATMSSFDLTDDRFSTLAAENDARERAMGRLAHDIRLRLGAYFSGRHAVADERRPG